MGKKDPREKERREGVQEHMKEGEEVGGVGRTRGSRERKDTMTESPTGRQKHFGKKTDLRVSSTREAHLTKLANYSYNHDRFPGTKLPYTVFREISLQLIQPI